MSKSHQYRLGDSHETVKLFKSIVVGRGKDFDKELKKAIYAYLRDAYDIHQPNEQPDEQPITQPYQRQYQEPYVPIPPASQFMQPIAMHQPNSLTQEWMSEIMNRLNKIEHSIYQSKEQPPTPTYNNSHEPVIKPIQTPTKPTIPNQIPDIETTSFDAIFKEKHNMELQDILTFFYNPSKFTEAELRRMNAIPDEKRFAMKSTINQYNTDVFKPMLRKYILCEALVDELSIDNDTVWTYLKSRYIQFNLDIYKFIVSRKLWQMLPNEIEDLLKGLEPFTMYKDETYPPKSNQNIFKNAFISQIDVCWSDTTQFQTI